MIIDFNSKISRIIKGPRDIKCLRFVRQNKVFTACEESCKSKLKLFWDKSEANEFPSTESYQFYVKEKYLGNNKRLSNKSFIKIF